MSDEETGRSAQDAPQRPDPRGDTVTALDDRLHADEARMARDEARLTDDERRLDEEERWSRRNWRLEIAIMALLALTAGALAMSWFALHRDVQAVARATPKDNSVGTSAIRDSAVTASKLADGAVTRAKLTRGAITGGAIVPGAVGTTAIAAGAVTRRNLANGSVGPQKLADDSVTGRAVAPDSLTAADINESTLTVGRATRATTAANAVALGGVAAGRYVARVTLVRQSSSTSTLRSKGPITAWCPSGSRVIAGGASIDGGARGVALVTSTPDGSTGWTAEAAAAQQPAAAWRLVVTAICATGG